VRVRRLFSPQRAQRKRQIRILITNLDVSFLEKATEKKMKSWNCARNDLRKEEIVFCCCYRCCGSDSNVFVGSGEGSWKMSV